MDKHTRKQKTPIGRALTTVSQMTIHCDVKSLHGKPHAMSDKQLSIGFSVHRRFALNSYTFTQMYQHHLDGVVADRVEYLGFGKFRA